MVNGKCVLSQCFLNKNNNYNSMCRARLTCMAVAARQRFAFFSRDFNLVASAVNEHWHQQQYVLKIVFFSKALNVFFNLFSILLSSFYDIVTLLFLLFFAVLMIAIFVTLMTPVTDYGHTKAKSLIICSPNSNPNPK